MAQVTGVRATIPTGHAFEGDVLMVHASPQFGSAQIEILPRSGPAVLYMRSDAVTVSPDGSIACGGNANSPLDGCAVEGVWHDDPETLASASFSVTRQPDGSVVVGYMAPGVTDTVAVPSTAVATA